MSFTFRGVARLPPGARRPARPVRGLVRAARCRWEPPPSIPGRPPPHARGRGRVSVGHRRCRPAPPRIEVGEGAPAPGGGPEVLHRREFGPAGGRLFPRSLGSLVGPSRKARGGGRREARSPPGSRDPRRDSARIVGSRFLGRVAVCSSGAPCTRGLFRETVVRGACAFRSTGGGCVPALEGWSGRVADGWPCSSRSVPPSHRPSRIRPAAGVPGATRPAVQSRSPAWRLPRPSVGVSPGRRHPFSRGCPS